VTEEEAFREVLSLLDSLKISYALTGGIAVSFYGHSRSTHDFSLILQKITG